MSRATCSRRSLVSGQDCSPPKRRHTTGKHAMAPPRSLCLNASDNVIIAVDEIPAGVAPEGAATARERIPKGHKMAVAAVKFDEPIRKFGQIIGFATRDFAREPHIGEGAYEEVVVAVEDQPTFQGYRRTNGKIGTRNYLAVLT